MKELKRKDLKGKYKKDFAKGEILKVGNYVIFINGLHTYAEKFSVPMIKLSEYQMPAYIRNIVF